MIQQTIPNKARSSELHKYRNISHEEHLSKVFSNIYGKQENSNLLRVKNSDKSSVSSVTMYSSFNAFKKASVDDMIQRQFELISKQ